MRIALATDAWTPQTNGVVTTLKATAATLRPVEVLVFPSLTDTFGLVVVEALACGVPAAAFPVPGPLDVIEPGVTGVLHAALPARSPARCGSSGAPAWRRPVPSAGTPRPRSSSPASHRYRCRCAPGWP